MANYTITSSAYLRNNYSAYRQMSIKASRDEATQKELPRQILWRLKKPSVPFPTLNTTTKTQKTPTKKTSNSTKP